MTTRPLPRQCPVCSGTVRKKFRNGPHARPDAKCPQCGSLERHRFLALLLRWAAPDLVQAGAILDVAPSNAMTPLLEALDARHVIRADLDPAADGRQIDLQASLTGLPLADDSVDVLLCYHVLEHIPDDRAAIGEIARVLSARGIAYLQVPWRPGVPTDEDPTADVETRLARFGQANHVRWYGDDFEDRLVAGGLDVCRVLPSDLLSEDQCLLYGIKSDEAMWLARSARGGAPGRMRDLSALAAPGLVDPRVAELEQRLEKMRASRDAAVARHEALLARWPLRLVVRLRRALRHRISARR